MRIEAEFAAPRIVICLAALVSFTLPVWANVAPPPPPEKGFKRVTIEHILKLESAITDYKLYSREPRSTLIASGALGLAIATLCFWIVRRRKVLPHALIATGAQAAAHIRPKRK